MLIKNMDMETKALIVWANIVSRNPSPKNLSSLRRRVREWNKAHESERSANLIRFIRDSEKETWRT